ncbi:MAG TPA: thymidylate kinase [Terriglobales bacterium]|nr:thymidylate kinase [Terriglobales bacterium]
MARILISFSGIDGAGKSTQIDKLREHLTAREIPVEILTFWDNVVVLSSLRSGFSRKVLQSDGQVGTPDKPAARNDKNQQSLPLFAGRSILHLLDVFRLRQIARHVRSSEKAGVVIFDRYIYDQLAALPLKKPWARAYARLILAVAPKPDVAYVLDAVPEEARARKPEYPLEFMRQYRESYLELQQLAPVNVIKPGMPDDVHAAILGRLTKLFDSPQAPVDSTVAA